MSNTELVVPRPMEVSLLTSPRLPLETLWVVWEQSRHNYPVPSPEEVHALLSDEPSFLARSNAVMEKYAKPYFPVLDDRTTPWVPWMEQVRQFREKFWTTVEMLFTNDVPVSENLNFVFLIENMPISLREQMVRHRIGVAFDPRLGGDIVPHIAESTWWSQTTRVLDLSNFYDEGFFFVPDGLPNEQVLVEESAYGNRYMNPLVEYHNHMRRTQNLYRDYVKAGVHVEDARQIIPLGFTHRITWDCNLKSLRHIIGKRTCWIAQLGIWAPMLNGMVQALGREVHPFFQSILDPPCIKTNEFKGCVVSGINVERIDGRDGVMAPCPLWLNHHFTLSRETAKNVENPQWVQEGDTDPDKIYYGMNGNPGFTVRKPFPGDWVAKTETLAKRMSDGRAQFLELWQRDVDTGAKLPVEA